VVRISTRKVVEVVESVGLRIEARGVDRSGGSTPKPRSTVRRAEFRPIKVVK